MLQKCQGSDDLTASYLKFHHGMHLQSALAKTLVLNAQMKVVSDPNRALKIDIPFFCSCQSMAGGVLPVLLPSPHELSR